MLLQNQHPLNKHLTASVLGVPNVGKSSLINTFLGTNLSIVTRFAQTTRNKYHCVFTVDHTEIVLVDTPGIHPSNKEFSKRMNQQAREGIRGVDLNLVLIDLTFSVARQIESIISGLRLTQPLGKTWVIFSKADKLAATEDDHSSIETLVQTARFLLEQFLPSLEKVFSVSAKRGDNMHLLVGALIDEAKEGPHLYPDGEISNKNVRFFACEYIREQIFLLLREEVPYQTAVVIEEYRDIREKEGVNCHISASILVNTPGQRAIVIGSKGCLIKEIGTLGRKKIEAMVGGKVFLNLHVKVVSKWFKNNAILEQIGLPRAVDSNRVWHSREKQRGPQ